MPFLFYIISFYFKYLERLYIIIKMIKLFLRYAKEYKIQVILAPIFKIFEAVFGLIVPFIVKNIIDYGINGNQGNTYILTQGGILLALGVVGFLMTMVCQILSINVVTKITYSLRLDMYKKINSFSYKEIDNFSVSSLQTRMSTDLVNAQNAFMMLLRLAIRAPFIVIGSIVMSMIISLQLSWIFIVCGILLGLIIFLIGYLCLPFNKKVQSSMDNLTNVIDDNLTGVRVIRALNKQDYELNRFNNISNNIERTYNRLSIISSLSNPLNLAIINTGLILIMYFGGIKVTYNELSQGDIVSLVNYMTQISTAIVVVANLIVTFSKGSISSKRILEILDTQSCLKTGDCLLNTNENIDIEFDNVSFSYNKNANNILSNISCKFESGKSYGIIGGTGAGKTCLINLLCHFYDADSGLIKIQNKNIQEYKSTDIYKNISLVSQNSVVFSGTIRSNLSLGSLNNTDEDLLKACEIAQAKDVISSKGGLDGLINQGGKNLSGGQKQRLTIARGLVKNGKILILDDSFSALDYKTDMELRKAIKDNYYGNKLIIYASQRVSTIKDCDEIIVMDKGKIIDIGNHKDLYKNCEMYKNICLSQNIEENIL